MKKTFFFSTLHICFLKILYTSIHPFYFVIFCLYCDCILNVTGPTFGLWLTLWVTSCVSVHLFLCTFWNIALKNAVWKHQDAHKFKKLCIKKTYAHVSVGYFFYRIRKNAINYDGNIFTAYIPPCASGDFVLWDGITRPDLVHSIYTQLWSSWKAWGKSVSKVFQYNWLCSQTAA